MSWPTSNLGTFTKIHTGKLDANAHAVDGEYPFFTCATEPLRISSYSYDCECVLVAGNGNLNVKYYQGKFDAYQRTYIVEKSPESQDQICLRYVYYFLEDYLEALREQSIGGIIKYIKLGNLTNAKIPLPPLAEQKRIAAILDAADALRTKRRESLAQLDTLLQSTFLEMFGDPVTNPMGWEVKPLGEVLNPARPLSYGVLKPGDYKEDGVIMLRIQDIRGGVVRDNDLHRVPNELSEQYKRTLLSGDEVVISLVGTIGLCAIIPRRYAGANVHRNLAVVVPGEAVQPVFLLHHMLSAHFQYQVSATTKGGIQKLLNLGDLKRIPVPLPLLDLQNRFATIVESIEAQKATQREHLEELDTLFAALQQRAFNGELTT